METTPASDQHSEHLEGLYNSPLLRREAGEGSNATGLNQKLLDKIVERELLADEMAITPLAAGQWAEYADKYRTIEEEISNAKKHFNIGYPTPDPDILP